MSVSSISSPSAPLPYNYLDTSSNTQAVPAVANDNGNDSNNDAGATQPPAPAPLPPGLGTRVDQLV